MKELIFEELSIEQKIGMTMTARVDCDKNPQELEDAMEMIRKHALGSVWVLPSSVEKTAEVIGKIKAVADYPILIMTDAENGLGDYKIGKHNAIGCTDNEELAYMFGKVTGLMAQKMGYNAICNPLLDMTTGRGLCGTNTRSIGSDKYQVTRLAMAEARGIKDAGVLTIAKHYPGSKECRQIDTHMAESHSMETEEELLDFAVYPYVQLNRAGLLDGAMTRHGRYINIDPDYPASLSAKVLDILRKQGFDGFYITDALEMMGIVAKYGRVDSKGLAVENGNDLALPWRDNLISYNDMLDSYRRGILHEERINIAAKRVLAAQHKTLAAPKFTELTKEDIDIFNRISRESIYAKVDEGLSPIVSADEKHYFVILCKNELDISNTGKIAVDTMTDIWYDPKYISDRLEKDFPNSKVRCISEYPSQMQLYDFFQDSAVGYDDVIFITYMEGLCFVGKECLTSRVISTIEALQVTNRVSAIVHFGNPFVLEDLPHIPRIIFGGVSSDSVKYSLDVMEGKLEPMGKPTYNVKLA